MKVLRTLAVIAALALMISELWRSWDVGRPVLFVLEHYFPTRFALNRTI